MKKEPRGRRTGSGCRFYRHRLNYGEQFKETAMVNEQLTVAVAVKEAATVKALTVTVRLSVPPWLND